MPQSRHREPGSQVGKRHRSHIQLYPSVAVTVVIHLLFSLQQMVNQSTLGQVENLPAAMSGALNLAPSCPPHCLAVLAQGAESAQMAADREEG